MKLLSLEIGDLGLDEFGRKKTYRSLQPGFKIDFHNQTEKGYDQMNQFQPFCFAGLNGSGKSNVLEALASIFYHWEILSAKFKPSSLKLNLKKNTSSPDAYTLKYLIAGKGRSDYTLTNADLVTLTKIKDREPEMFVEPGPRNRLDIEKRLIRFEVKSSKQEMAPSKEFLPDLVVGYSSGENETLSLPFIKTRLLHLDEYRDAVLEGRDFDEPETSLLYVDEEMSQAVLLAIMLLEDRNTLKPLDDELKIKGIQSFRMNLNMQILYLDEQKKVSAPILNQLETKIEKLKNCATSWFEIESDFANSEGRTFPILTLDFFVDDKTKRTFKENFGSSFRLFRLFQTLYELNNNIVGPGTKRSVYGSTGFYTDGKLAIAGPEDRVFYFQDFMILKEVFGEEKPEELLLREFSDGEHQFIHTMGICLMLKDRRTLLLLDEPETHFNPDWRAKFINVLKKSIEAGGANHFQKDIILTTHSPFIISDCKRDFVKWFETGKAPRDIGFQTYGTSIDYIIKRTTDKLYLNSEMSLNELRHIIETGNLEELEEAAKHFGKSGEKQFLYQEIARKTLK